MSSNIVPVSFERHGKKAFRRFTSYAFAANEMVIPLVAAELSKAALSFPIGFLKQGEETILVGVMGLEPGSNLFVGPDGKWVGTYVPAAFRAYPFILANAQDNRQVLCINETSGLVVDDLSGEPFFTEKSNPSEAIKSILDFLTKIHNNRLLTDSACQVVAKFDLLEPWSITTAGENGPRNVTGLWRVSESKLGLLSNEGFLELRTAGAIALAYGQLISMGHMPMLERLSQIKERRAAPLPDTLDSIFGAPRLSDEIEIDWSNFRT